MMPLGVFCFEPHADRDFWEKIFENAVVCGFGEPEEDGETTTPETMVATAARVADLAVEAWKARWPAPKLPEFPAMHIPSVNLPQFHPPTPLELMVKVQEEISGYEMQLEGMRKMSEMIPEEMRDAFMQAQSPPIERWLAEARERLSRLQTDIENSAAPPESESVE